ncbi:hypothetical protein D3C71_2246080 [compost metagenome]
MESMYQSAVKKISEDESGGRYHQFRQQLVAIINNAGCTGWGFEEALAGIYGSYFSEYEEELVEA